jgi:hypothetical protein
MAHLLILADRRLPARDLPNADLQALGLTAADCAQGLPEHLISLIGNLRQRQPGDAAGDPGAVDRRLLAD